MEVVPTGDGDDDGVIWYRCPQCQGFLPKLSSASNETDTPEADGGEGDSSSDVERVSSGKSEGSDISPAQDSAGDSSQDLSPSQDHSSDLDDDLPFDSPAEMMAAQTAAQTAGPSVEPSAPSDQKQDSGSKSKSDSEPEEEPEPVAEYAARLEEALSALPPDSTGGEPYRPWETYEIDQCIQHLAWEDCGIVVGKEELPGGRLVIKVFFQEAGVVRLIEQAAQ